MSDTDSSPNILRVDFSHALRNRDVNQVREILRIDPSLVHEVQEDGRLPAIAWVSLMGFGEIVEVLLEAGADIHTRTANGSTALSMACRRCQEWVVRILLHHAADVNAANDTGITPLHEAAAVCHVPTVEILLQHGAQVDCRNRNGGTPLFLAARSVDGVDVMRVLLQQQADPNAVSLSGHTPLHMAAYFNNADAVSVLVEWGADLSIPDRRGILHSTCRLILGMGP